MDQRRFGGSGCWNRARGYGKKEKTESKVTGTNRKPTIRMEIIDNLNRILGHDLKESFEANMELKVSMSWIVASLSIRLNL